MATQYGRTPWGKAWIDALTAIDVDSKRLNRGRSYARRGMVLDIRVDAAIRIRASVQGSRRTPYRVTIELEEFSVQQKQRIIDVVRSTPSIARTLSLGTMPDTLLSILQDEKIALFPARWDDIHADCSCPDWANPCKHLAAVYYLVAQEIDNNPFLILNLRGLSTKELMNTTGALLGAADHAEEHSAQVTKVVSLATSMKECAEGSRELSDEDLQRFHLDFDEPNIDVVFRLLPDETSFCAESNFKADLLKMYHEVQTQSLEIQVQDQLSHACDQLHMLFEWDDVHGITQAIVAAEQSPELDALGMSQEWHEISIPSTRGAKAETYSFDGHRAKLPELVRFCMQQPLDLSLQRQTPSFRFLNLAVTISLALCRSGAYAPEIVPMPNNTFRIRYLPRATKAVAQQALTMLSKLMPAGLVFDAKRKGMVSRQSLLTVFAEILSAVVHELYTRSKQFSKAQQAELQKQKTAASMMRFGFSLSQTSNPTISQRLDQAFRSATLFSPEGFQEKSIARALHNWLARFNVQHSSIGVVFVVEELNDSDTFQLSVSVQDKAQSLLSFVSLSDLIHTRNKVFGKKPAIVRAEVLRSLAICAEYFPRINEIVDSGGNTALRIDLGQMSDFLQHSSALLELLGVQIVLPKSLSQLLRPELHIFASTPKNSSGMSFLSLLSILDFNYHIALGDRVVSDAEFARLLKNADGLVKFKGQYVMISASDAAHMLATLQSKPPKLHALEALRASLVGEYKGSTFNFDTTLRTLLENFTKVDEFSMPDGIRAVLRPYQERGVHWLHSTLERGFGAVLADDMGLGKTLQVQSLLLKLKQSNRLHAPALIVCPTTLVSNWQKEIAKFTPDLRVLIYHGSARELRGVHRSATALQSTEKVVNSRKKPTRKTSKESFHSSELRSDLVAKSATESHANTVNDADQVDIVITTYGLVRRDKEVLGAIDWSLVAIDEAQAIKNPESDQSKSVKLLRAPYRIAMTGTPVENRLVELWSLFEFVNHGFLGNVTEFKREYVMPIEKYRSTSHASQLRRMTEPFMLRRVKSDKNIINDLPEKIITDEFVSMTKEQTALYTKLVNTALAVIEGESDTFQRAGLIFQLINALKQVCNHPSHYAKRSSAASTASGKAQRFMDLLQAKLDMREKTLVFTQYKEMGLLLQSMISEEIGEEALFFHGGLSRKQRDEMVTAFQEDPNSRVLVVSLKAGGTGLNLTAAASVIHYDLWWNPAVENQATDRSYRIGQTKNVQVHRLITNGTFEEKINEIIQSKVELADMTIGSGEKWIAHMSNKELRSIFNLDGVAN